MKEFFAPLKPVEISLPAALPEPGSDTRQLKILSGTYSAHDATFTLQARTRSSYDLPGPFKSSAYYGARRSNVLR